MDRRRFLHVTGATLGGTVVAGCAGPSGDGTTDSPQQTPDGETPDDADGTPTPGPGPETPDQTPPSNTDTFSHRITVRGNDYYRLGIQQGVESVLTWTAEITDETPGPFDVFLFTASQLETYQQLVEGSDGSLTYIEDGTVEGIQTRATRTVTLDAGDYSLIVDNTTLGAATCADADDRLEITLDAEIRPA